MNKNIGIVGDGQLAKMLITAGISSGFNFYVLPLKNKAPQESICYGLATIVSSFQELAKHSDVITYEIDSAPVDKLEELAKEEHQIIPSPLILSTIQSKIVQKEFYLSNHLPTLRHNVFSTYQEFKEISKYATTGLIIKREFGGYNGKGVLKYHLNSPESEDQLKEFLKGGGRYSVEELLDLKMEISVLVARDHDGYVVAYHPMKMVCSSKKQILLYQETLNYQEYCDLIKESQKVARELVEKMNGVGIFAIEFLVSKHQRIFINEISPRPHNSGHHTIISTTNQTSQYQQLLRILNHRNVVNPIEKYALMFNILGSEDLVNVPYDYDYQIIKDFEDSFINDFDDSVNRGDLAFEFNDYGKKLTYPYRKVGHYTVCYPNVDVLEKVNPKYDFESGQLFQSISRITIPKKNNSKLKSNSRPLSENNLIQENLKSNQHLEISKAENQFNLSMLPELDNDKDTKPLVGIIMGSISDYSVMKEACQILEEFKIPYEKRVVSAHRTPYEMIAYGTYALQRGLKVIIAGAGGAAHLPGMTASVTNIPVVGVPVKSSNMSGLDSLYSIVQMPRGVPVATMAINGSMNAGLMALKMLATNPEYEWLNNQLDQYRQEMNKKSVASNQEL